MLSVGLVGASGYMGAPFYNALLGAMRQDKLRFVLLHRPSTDLSSFPDELEKRVIDLEKPDQSKLREAIQGLDIVVSAISHQAFDAQFPLIEALAHSPSLITFFPSEYATPMRDEDAKSPYLHGRGIKAKIVNRAKELGVPTTIVANATTPEILFGWPGFSSFHPKENRLELYEPQGNGTRGMTSKEFSGQALVHLILNRTQDLPNREFSFVELDYSSKDLISTFTRIHNGVPPSIDTYTEKNYLRDLNKAGFGGAMKAARMKGLAVGCKWPGEKISGFPGWTPRSLEAYIRDYM